MNPIEVPRRFPDDALPPEGQYNSQEKLRTAINAWAAPRGYAFMIARSRKTPNSRRVVIFNYDRGPGVSPPPSAPKAPGK